MIMVKDYRLIILTLGINQLTKIEMKIIEVTIVIK
jgi:hypothetical protein